MNRSRTLLRSALCALGVLFALPAHAEPLLRGGDATGGAMAQLPATVQRSLADQVRVARARTPAVFAAVADLRGVRPDVYRATRYRRPAVVRELRGLGADALLPMLDVLAVHGYPRALSTEERDALESGLLEAVGELRDRRAEPVLRAAFLGLSREASVRAAAQGLGNLCGDGEVALLLGHARDAGTRGAAALEGLGRCRRPEAIRPLASALDTLTDADAVRAAARGLANAGSTWAQQSAAVAGQGGVAMDPTIPALAVGTLVRAYARALASGADEQVRNELAYAVLAVGHADGPRLLTDAAHAATTPAARSALEALAATAQRALGRR